MRRFVLIVCLIMITVSCASNLRAENILVKQKNFTFYENDKIIVSSIGGWHEAVGLLENSLVNSLFDMYTPKKDKAHYNIEGSIFAKKHWKRRIYLYHDVNLRILDNKGNVVMTIKNTKPIWQDELAVLTDEIASLIRRSMRKTARPEAEPKAEIEKKELGSLEELLKANTIQVDAITKLLIEKGLITEEEFYTKMRQVQQDYESPSE